VNSSATSLTPPSEIGFRQIEILWPAALLPKVKHLHQLNGEALFEYVSRVISAARQRD